MAILKLIPRALLFCLFLNGTVFAGTLPIWELMNTSNRVLLMGSVHFLRASDYPLPEGVNAAYDLADTLVMEINMDALDPALAQTTMMSMGVSQSGQSLRDALGEANYKEASRRAEDLGVPFTMFDQYEPWFAALTITQLRMMQLGFDPAWGIETQFTQQAAGDAKNIEGLETLEEQLGFMDNLDDKTQQQFLLQSLEDAATLQDQVETIVAAWRTGDVNTLEELMLEGFASAPALEDALLIQRNRNWIRSIKNLQNKSDNYLVIVGAMHLVGENSVVAMLEDKGISIRQLTDTDLN
ncbi:MAG: TraB/GumN family protein [Gammaproteobacteria bacterium]|nr:TraB/GumN family protein [Gammaproteobacteria bacterium]MCP4088564.1 TraB/GumN family protein [Gammaproteobacteria bacterium]MCP4276528.1 TraB/GumN family protein [Gammaproteobacteria bacterium]MCP4832405.1 TraB/GumN family protein [Gammaproteobacteria bacterium]MCP4929081.1 TraB/GumN family protein [Gammaproteobacteria bacterium]